MLAPNNISVKRDKMKSLVSAATLCVLAALCSQALANDVSGRCYDFLHEKVRSHNVFVGLFRATLDPDYDEDLAAINCKGIDTEEKLEMLMECHGRMESGKASVIASFCSGETLSSVERMNFALDCYNDKSRHRIQDQFSRSTACLRAKDTQAFEAYTKCVETALSRAHHGYSQKRFLAERCARAL